MDIKGVEDHEVYGDQYQNHLFEQYKMYVDMTDRISGRRQTANNFFLSINTALIAIVTFLKTKAGTDPILLSFVTGIAGFLLCFTWYRLIKSYKDLNSARFKIIQKMEESLPLSPYKAEWTLVEEGRNPKFYRPFTKIESWIPWMFLFLYAVLVIAFVM